MNFRYNNYHCGCKYFYHGYKFLYWKQFNINLLTFTSHYLDSTIKTHILRIQHFLWIQSYLSTTTFLVDTKLLIDYNICGYKVTYRLQHFLWIQSYLSTTIATSIMDGNTIVYNTITWRQQCIILSQKQGI